MTALRAPLTTALALPVLLSGAAAAAPDPRQAEQAKSAHSLGLRYLERGRHEVAARFFRRASRLLPKAPGPHRGLGLALAAGGDCEQAVAALRTYLDRLAAGPAQRAPRPEAVRALRECERRLRTPLVVTSLPRGATVLLDGERAGSTPLELKEVPPGPHRVRLELAGHSALEREVEVAEGETRRVHLRLLRTARLDLLTRPRGAALTLDGEPAGETPRSLSGLAAGPHRIELSAPTLHRPWIGTARLEPGETLTLNVPLVEGGGLLSVRSEPEGAAVTLDDVPLGHTPFGPNLVAEGERWLRLTRPGHALAQRRLEVGPDAPREVEVALEPLRLDLRVRGLLPGATVYVDGRAHAAEEGWVRGLEPGEHEVAAWQAGHQVWSHQVRLEAGRPAEVEARLAPLAGRGGASPLLLPLLAGGVAVGALAGAALTVGAAEEGGGSGTWVLAAGLGTLGAGAAVLAIRGLLDLPAAGPPEEEDLELGGIPAQR